MKCKHCQSENVVETELRGVAKMMLPEEGYRVYRCQDCSRLTGIKKEEKKNDAY